MPKFHGEIKKVDDGSLGAGAREADVDLKWRLMFIYHWLDDGLVEWI